jgi:hypothetical protein
MKRRNSIGCTKKFYGIHLIGPLKAENSIGCTKKFYRIDFIGPLNDKIA